MKHFITLLLCHVVPLSVCAQTDWEESESSWDDDTEITIPMSQKVKQTIALKEGCNWVSVYVQGGLKVSDITASGVTRIQSQQGETIYNAKYGRVGPVELLEPGHGYKIYTTRDFTIQMEGYWCGHEQGSHDVVKGWNWIGVPYLSDRELAGAFTNPSLGDVVADQTSSATYNGTAWSGTLTTLHSGASYMYKSVNNKILTFKY